MAKALLFIFLIVLYLLDFTNAISNGSCTRIDLNNIKYFCTWKHGKCATTSWNYFFMRVDNTVIKNCWCPAALYSVMQGNNWHHTYGDINWAGAADIECFFNPQYNKNFWSHTIAQNSFDSSTNCYDPKCS
jgi:hypothetical protein